MKTLRFVALNLVLTGIALVGAAEYLRHYSNPLIRVLGEPAPVVVPEAKEQTIAELNELAGVKIEPEPNAQLEEDLGLSERAAALIKSLKNPSEHWQTASGGHALIRYHPSHLYLYYFDSNGICDIKADSYPVNELFTPAEHKRIGAAWVQCFATVRAREEKAYAERAKKALDKAIQEKGK